MTARPSFRQALNRAVADKRLLVIPGAYDALSALLIERAGFDTMFVGGFPVAGARYGVPDIGLKGFADIANAVRDIIAACDVPVLVDIDDGYGDVKNAVHTVQSYERMGASAVFLEDQAWPKRCGHMAGKKVVPAEVMEAKIKATIAERLDAETLICVRTDARAVHGLDERCGVLSAISAPAPRRSSSRRRRASRSSSVLHAHSTCRNSPTRWSAGARRCFRPRNSNSSGSTPSASDSRPSCMPRRR
jgi:2-methylisocitrate lyase-like PEP mutase family enzyme